jgi:broad specificity phosphatase PhoE
MLAALGEVADEAAGGTALVLTHGWALRIAVAGLLRLPPEEAAALARTTNCSVTVLDVARDRAEIVVYGGCAHLHEAGLGSGHTSAASA